MNLHFKFFFAILSLLFFSVDSLQAQLQTPVDLALRHIEKNREKLGLTSDDISNYIVNDLYQSKHNGVTHVYLKQTHNDIELSGAIINVNILPDGRILNMGNRYMGDLKSRVNATVPKLTPREAVINVKNHLEVGGENPAPYANKGGNPKVYLFEEEGLALEPISAALVYDKQRDKSIRLAWEVVWYQKNAQHWWIITVDAIDGTILQKIDQVIHCSFGADHVHDHTCNDAVDATVYTPAPLRQEKSEKSNRLNTGGTYNVFAMPLETPNHGSRTVEIDPANDTASPFGWHDVDGVDGVDYTITRGNNVHAYQDIFDLNQSIGDEPDGGADLNFDLPLDLSTGRPYTQVDAAVVNLFYWNNIIHDVWYQYGFDEPAGNFQVNNFGKGGIEGDWIRAEALDGSGVGNANFATGADSTSARMQMYIWGARESSLPGRPNDRLVVLDSAGNASSYSMVQAQFGGLIPFDTIVSPGIIVLDTVETFTDACQEIVNSAEIEGNIALLDRGNCQFGSKALRAENSGAIAVIICDDRGDFPFPMIPGDDGGDVTVPVVMVSQRDCNEIKIGLESKTILFGRDNFIIPQPGPRGRDSDFDNGVIVHEYTHGISIRLTGGPSEGRRCLSGFEQAGEGWSDWFGLVMQTTEDDTANDRRGIGSYLSFQATNGDGIRDHPYSRDMTENPHVYSDINGVSVPHGVGSVWCAMIWDLYWNLVDEYDFDSDFYNGTGGNNIAMQLVLDGLKLQPCNPTFTDARDAIISADQANYNGENFCLIWETFARRGLGVNAQAGGETSFDVPGICDQRLKISKSAVVEVEAGEEIEYQILVINDLPETLRDLTVNDIFPAGTTLVDGSASCPGALTDNDFVQINIDSMETGDSLLCSFRLAVDPDSFSYVLFEEGFNGSLRDWDRSSNLNGFNWTSNSLNPYQGRQCILAVSSDEASDQIIENEDPLFVTGEKPTLSFWHYYNTERTWDGGVVEYSIDNGATWEDLGSRMFRNGYTGPIEINPTSAISGRPAFHGNSFGYVNTLIDLSDFIDQDIKFRFRLVCDAATSVEGWYVDEVRFYGNFFSVENEACVSGPGVDEICSSAFTTILGEEPVNAVDDPTNNVAVNLYPNPSTGLIHVGVEQDQSGKAQIEIMSIDGRVLENQLFDALSGVYTFDLSGYSAGIYLVRVETAAGIELRKLILQ